ncbi:membrane-spanning 4-domains subfamily A member 6D-like isoform X1 [Hyaena hyaena]|uniref:membrane-spanning 4-domains subfamily A member 6D-like isoform X1 n=1 Tax=Hyaena hyaena TaxID=95912 RepID=UPI001920B3D3|nr:membrane-spanning 4-domains subfamily A member 6D-like isoform X1 [Hyaena hyaena]
MISQPMTNEAVVVLTPNGIRFPQTGGPKPTSQRRYSLVKQLKAEVKVLGAIQILCGVMVLILGIIFVSAPNSPSFTPVFSIPLKAAYPFVGGLCFVISGTLSVIMEKKSTKPLVWSSVAANILSSLCALVGFILLSVTLAALDPAFRKCTFNQKNRELEETTFHYYVHPLIDKECFTAKSTLTGTLSVMLIYTVLELCLAVLTAAVWWKQAHSDFLGSVLFLPQSYKNKSSTASKAFHADPGYKELVTS